MNPLIRSGFVKVALTQDLHSDTPSRLEWLDAGAVRRVTEWEQPPDVPTVYKRRVTIIEIDTGKFFYSLDPEDHIIDLVAEARKALSC